MVQAHQIAWSEQKWQELCSSLNIVRFVKIIIASLLSDILVIFVISIPILFKAFAKKTAFVLTICPINISSPMVISSALKLFNFY